MQKNVVTTVDFLLKLCKVCGDFSERVPTKIVFSYGSNKNNLKSDITIQIDVTDSSGIMELESRLTDVLDSLDDRLVYAKAYMKNEYLCQSTLRANEDNEPSNGTNDPKVLEKALGMIPDLLKQVNEGARIAQEHSQGSNRALEKALDMNNRLVGEVSKCRHRIVELESLLSEARVLINNLETALKEVSGEDNELKAKLMNTLSTLLEQHSPLIVGYLANKLIPSQDNAGSMPPGNQV